MRLPKNSNLIPAGNMLSVLIFRSSLCCRTRGSAVYVDRAKALERWLFDPGSMIQMGDEGYLIS